MTARLCGLAVVVIITSAAPVAAEIGALDPVPAATLLFPYFEAEIGTASETDTLLWVENTAASAQLAHVIVWSDRGVPVHDFDLYLTPHGRTRIPMRALLAGSRPTSEAGDGQSGCSFPLPTLGGDEIADLRAAVSGKRITHTGDESLGCPSADLGDTLGRGYVTIDTVTACSTGEVTAGTYWSTRLATANTLLGSFMITHGRGRPAYGEQAIHIEASTTDARVDGSGDSTFYGDLVDWTAADHRERLPTMWATPFDATRSDLIVWRDTKRKLTDPMLIGCNASAQTALDLAGTGVQYVDEAEQLTDHGASGASIPFVRATGRYPVGGAHGLPTPYRAGVILTNLNFAGEHDPAGAVGLAQSVVLSVRRPDALGTALDATLSLGIALDDGYATSVGPMTPATSEYGQASDERPRAMLDPRAAASLLLPYFEVSLDDPNAAQTRFSVVNTSASARLAKVSLFTDRGVPTAGFMVYLTGFDVASIDLRILFAGGLATRTASDGQDRSDEISPQGSYSQDINYASCNSSLPTPLLSDAEIAFLRAVHTGKPRPEWDGRCGGRDLGDRIARGYIVIDTLFSCTDGPLSTSDLSGGYLDGRDSLGGSFELRSRAGNTSFAAPLVALHAITPALASGDMTFYGWLDGWGVTPANVRREGLPNAWRVPFVNNAGVGTTELVMFRPVHRTPEPYVCDSVPEVFGGTLASLIAYDGNDNSGAIEGFQPGFVAGRIPIGEGGIPVPFGQGALELNLDFSEGENALPSNDAAHMGFVGAIHRLAGNSDPVFAQGFPLHLAGEP